jgi:YHS domain-containing protein
MFTKGDSFNANCGKSELNQHMPFDSRIRLLVVKGNLEIKKEIEKMDKLRLTFVFVVAVLLSVAGVRTAEHEGHGDHGNKADNAPKQQSADKDIIEKQKSSYPLTTCVVLGEKLDGDMGAAVDYVYKGRLVRFCCKGCIKKFENDPDTYLKKIDEAAKAAKTSASDAKTAPDKFRYQPKANEGSSDHSSHGAAGAPAAGGHGCCN